MRVGHSNILKYEAKPSADVHCPAASIKQVAAKLAFNTMSFYNENQTGQIPGKLPDTWWEGGFLFNMLIQYWYYTGDTSYNPTTTQGLLWQAGTDYDYMPANWSSYLVRAAVQIRRDGVASLTNSSGQR